MILLGLNGGKFTGSVDFPLCMCAACPCLFLHNMQAFILIITHNNSSLTLNSCEVRNVFGKYLLILEYKHPYL